MAEAKKRREDSGSASQQAALAQGWTGGEGEGVINGNRLEILERIFKN